MFCWIAFLLNIQNTNLDSLSEIVYDSKSKSFQKWQLHRQKIPSHSWTQKRVLCFYSKAPVSLPTDPPSLYVDLEGVSLGRHGFISILSIYLCPFKKAYLVDLHSLGTAAFSTTTSGGVSLKSVPESTTIPTVFFDIRNYSYALFSLFQICVEGIKDLQLMELASRSGLREFVSGLAKCIDR
jgi:hypothetical protein